MAFEVYVKLGPHEWTFTQKPYVNAPNGATTNASNTVTHENLFDSDNLFSIDDAGSPITGDGIPDGTFITAVTNHVGYDELEISELATATATGVVLTFERPRRFVDDGTYVLSGMDFGWDSPSGLFLRQPNPMTASFAVTLPDFTLLEASISSQVAIEVKASGEGDVIASFYGDVTDLRAVTRKGRTGVTLSVVAVDYTVRLAELLPVQPYITGETPDSGGYLEKDAARAIWFYAPISGDPAAVWTSPDRQMGTALFANLENQTVEPREYLSALLDQAVNMTSPTDPPSRMIVAPVVDAGELVSVSGEPTFTLDTVPAPPLAESIPSLILTSAALRRELSWRSDKKTAPDRVVVHGTPVSDPTLASFNYQGSYTLDMSGSGTGTYAELTGQFYLETEAGDTALFYAIHALPRWQLDPLTIPVSRGDFADLIPANLFPNWALDEGDPNRGACYSTVVQVNDVPLDQTPGLDIWDLDPGVLKGWLVGARCRVAGGELEIDVTIRQQAEEPE